MRLEEMQDEPLSSYREAARRRLQELMLRENYPPGHPLVVATGHHLDMSFAAEAAERYSAPSMAHFYQGCDLFYAVPARSATPPSPEQKVAPAAPVNLAKVTI
ncbi:uncharacterized protein [Halyomorpha halys]|uniref:uncharacterized protein isoform X2 n=1 Tax=Halyomorpha halys TaxID=286706 RepID=UPI0006D4F7F9